MAKEQETAAPSVGTLLAVRHYPYILSAGLLFDFARIGMAFLGPYYMEKATHSPRLVQVSPTLAGRVLTEC